MADVIKLEQIGPPCICTDQPWQSIILIGSCGSGSTYHF